MSELRRSQPDQASFRVADKAPVQANSSAQCLLSNGKCPSTCKSYESSRALTERHGGYFMGNSSRTKILSDGGLGTPQGAISAASVITSCKLEPLRKKG